MIDEKKLIEKMWNRFNSHYNNANMFIEEVTATANMVLSDVQKMIEEQEKVGEWIPVSERLPESKDKHEWVKCNVTVMRSHWPTSSYDFCDSPYDELFVMDAMYDVTQKIWHLGDHSLLNALIDIEDSPLNGDYVIAWMPLPEPYKE